MLLLALTKAWESKNSESIFVIFIEVDLFGFPDSLSALNCSIRAKLYDKNQ